MARDWGVRHPDGKVTVGYDGRPLISRRIAEEYAESFDAEMADGGCPECTADSGKHVVAFRDVPPPPWEDVGTGVQLAPAGDDRTGKLSAGNPEPPPGTHVLDDCGERWVRDGESGWLRLGHEDGDPESWVKVAGNYGPVTVLEWGSQ